jgi:hypothetical protein
MSPLKLYKTSVSSATDKSLCEFMLSTNGDSSIRSYKRIMNLSFQEDANQISRRLRFLKEQKKENPDDFLAHCRSYEIFPSHPATESDSESDYSSDDESFVSKPIVTNKRATTTTTTTSTKLLSRNTMTVNDFGKRIVVPLPNGLIFCIVWTNVKLDPSTLQIKVAKDGYSVIQRIAKPIPFDASELLEEYNWGMDSHHFVVQALEDATKKMKKAVNETNKWVESPLISLDKEIIGSFVNCRGDKTNTLEAAVDNEGRQRISFFVKTVESEEVGPCDAKFGSSSRESMVDDDDDDEKSAVNHVQNDLDNLRSNLANFHKANSDEISGMKTGMQDIATQLAQITQMMMQQAPAGPVPDNHPSSLSHQGGY